MSCSAMQTMLRQECREVDERCGGGLHRKLGNSVRTGERVIFRAPASAANLLIGRSEEAAIWIPAVTA
jgi:hypothetical protein